MPFANWAVGSKEGSLLNLNFWSRSVKKPEDGRDLFVEEDSKSTEIPCCEPLVFGIAVLETFGGCI
jgi:hypothetical protein